jgi:hypothetical protein
LHLGAIRTSDPTAATEKFRDLAQKLKDAEAKLDKLTKELEISSELSEFAGVLELPKVCAIASAFAIASASAIAFAFAFASASAIAIAFL